MPLKFGKLAPKPHRDTLLMSKYIGADALPAPPEKRAWEYRVKSAWGMFLNNELGICVIAACLHWIMAATANTDKPAIFTDAEALRAYSAITGYVPGDPSTDQGTAWTDALAYWREIGFTDVNGTVHKILGWAAVGLTIPELNQALNLFGGLLIGTNVTQSMMDQFNAGQPWNAPFDGGIIGGHGIPELGYGGEGRSVITWNAEEQGDNTLPSNYDEAYCVVTQDFLDAAGMAPSGIDLATLQIDIASLPA